MQAAEKTPDLIQKAIQLETDKKFEECDTAFQELIKTEADNAEVYMRYGQFLCRTQSFEKAKDILNKGLEIQPASPFTWFYLAVVYVYLERPDNVEICYNNAMLLDPENDRYLKGFVDFLFKEGRIDEARGYIEKIMQDAEEGDETSYYMLALSAWNEGDMVMASEYFEKASLVGNDNAHAIFACMECYLYLEKFEELENFTDKILSQEGLDPAYRPLIKMMKYVAIFNLNPSMSLRDRIEILEISQHNPSENPRLKQFNFNMWAYRHMIRNFYIERLNSNLDYAEGFLKDPSKTIYFIGESHTFEPLHLNLEIAGEKRRVASKLVMGIKAFHLSNAGRNQMKTVFEERCKQLPQNCVVGISIGEIDCRPTEGFVPYFMKNPEINQEEHMLKTLTTFVEYIEETLAFKTPQKIYIMGIPAPSLWHKDDINDKEQMRIKVIALYNKTLQEVCASKDNVEILDFYNMTVNADGHSTDRWHMNDRVHLKPAAYVEAFKLLADRT